MIEAKRLGRSFGPQWALREADFQCPPGAFVAVLGRNGAGKTTFIRLLTGQLRPTEGSIHIQGLDVSARPRALRSLMGVMPETEALMDALSAHHYLHFVGRLHGLAPAQADERIQTLQELLEIDFQTSKPISDFSFGMKKRTALAAALIHNPRVLFLDEPFEGLDPITCRTLELFLARLRQGGLTLVMTSHLLDRSQSLCERFLVLDQGRIRADRRREEILEDHPDLETWFLDLASAQPGGGLPWT